MAANIKTCTVLDAKKALESNPKAVMIDVREQEEIDEIAATVGNFFPMSQIDPNTFDVDCNVQKNQAIFLLCRSGGRSMRVAVALAEAGFTDLTNVAGGITAWESQGLPVRRGKN